MAIAATTAIFSVISAPLLRPLPVHDAGRLVRFGVTVNNDDSFRARRGDPAVVFRRA